MTYRQLIIEVYRRIGATQTECDEALEILGVKAPGMLLSQIDPGKEEQDIKDSMRALLAFRRLSAERRNELVQKADAIVQRRAERN